MSDDEYQKVISELKCQEANDEMNQELTVKSTLKTSNSDELEQFRKGLAESLVSHQSNGVRLRTLNSGRNVNIINSHNNSSACLIQ